MAQLLFFENSCEADDDSDAAGDDQRVIQNLATAAEYLVAADILQRNWSCSMAAAHLRYDLIAEIVVPRRIQVKMVIKPRLMGGTSLCYRFGKSGKKNQNLDSYGQSIDLFALVAFDRKKIIYVLPKNIIGERLTLRTLEFTDERSDLSWSDVLREWGVE